jgi:hypothetical protein
VLCLLVLPCIVTSAACRHGPAAPERLLDGSPAIAPTVELASIGEEAIASKVEVVAAGRLARNTTAATCLEEIGLDARAGPVVTRTGVDGKSVTVRAVSGPGLHACDGTGKRRRDQWCGRAYGRVEDGRLGDPRLDLTCTDAAGEAIAFAWIEPRSDARYVAVRQRGFIEVHKTAADLPVRVTTTDVSPEESAAAFEISEHDFQGALLRRYTLKADVAG